MKRLLAGAVAAAMTGALVISMATTTASADAAQAAQMVQLVNAFRQANGVAPLAVDPALATVATNWAQQLANNCALSHNPNLQSQAPAGWTTIGENVGDGPDVQTIETLLEQDPPHRANLLNPAFDRIGVGVVSGCGQLWAVQDFTGGTPGTPAATTATTVPATTATTAPATAVPASTPAAPVNQGGPGAGAAAGTFSGTLTATASCGGRTVTGNGAVSCASRGDETDFGTFSASSDDDSGLGDLSNILDGFDF